MSEYHCFDIPLCERNALLTAEDLQQHRDPLGPGQAGINGWSTALVQKKKLRMVNR
jgi:hypothetical protein